MTRKIAPKAAGSVLIAAGLALAASPFLPWSTGIRGTSFLQVGTYVVILLGLLGVYVGLTVRGGTAAAHPGWLALVAGVLAGLLVLRHWLDIAQLHADLGGSVGFGLILALLAALALAGAGLWAVLGRSASGTRSVSGS